MTDEEMTMLATAYADELLCIYPSREQLERNPAVIADMFRDGIRAAAVSAYETGWRHAEMAHWLAVESAARKSAEHARAELHRRAAECTGDGEVKS